MLKIKSGVKPQLLVIAAALANISQVESLELVITSGTDGKHMIGSKHYNGEALDLRISNLTITQRDLVRTKLKQRLGVNYDIVLEKDHIHIEYDKKG